METTYNLEHSHNVAFFTTKVEDETFIYGYTTSVIDQEGNESVGHIHCFNIFEHNIMNEEIYLSKSIDEKSKRVHNHIIFLD